MVAISVFATFLCLRVLLQKIESFRHRENGKKEQETSISNVIIYVMGNLVSQGTLA